MQNHAKEGPSSVCKSMMKWNTLICDPYQEFLFRQVSIIDLMNNIKKPLAPKFHDVPKNFDDQSW